MLVKTILNKLEKFKSFVYGSTYFEQIGSKQCIVIELLARQNSKGQCKACGKHCPMYDKQLSRQYEYVPLWNIPCYFRYASRRVNCKAHGIHVEQLPWVSGKEHMTTSYQYFLATWAKRLSWKETASVFGTSWDSVYRAVAKVVEYGLAHREWDNVEQLGVDEIAVFKGHCYLTMVYQLDKGLRRLLWCGEERKITTLTAFFNEFGETRTAKLKFVCSDMWRPYLKVIKQKAINALNILDRFHIMKKFNEAIDEVRRQEVKDLKAEGHDNVLHQGRWLLLKRKENLNEKQTVSLDKLLHINLKSIKAYLMREDFQQFWSYTSAEIAAKFLKEWTTRTMESTIAPMKKVAKMLCSHEALILNWFTAKGALSSGVVEGLNNKAKLTMRKAYGFKTVKCLKIALYHQMGNLKEPPVTHRFC